MRDLIIYGIAAIFVAAHAVCTAGLFVYCMEERAWIFCVSLFLSGAFDIAIAVAIMMEITTLF